MQIFYALPFSRFFAEESKRRGINFGEYIFANVISYSEKKTLSLKSQGMKNK